MKSVILGFETDSQLEQCTRFLLRAHPLNYTAAVKKSQVPTQPGIAAMWVVLEAALL
jgi:hypothetical protein